MKFDVSYRHCALSEVLEYQNERIVDSFSKKYCVTKEQSMLIFQETLKWLWLCHESEKVPELTLFIDKTTYIIDEMWHTFILFTKDYRNFCLDYFGHFIDHEPSHSGATKSDWKKKDSQLEREKYRSELEAMYEFIERKCGKKTLVRWFREFRDQYSPSSVQRSE